MEKIMEKEISEKRLNCDHELEDIFKLKRICWTITNKCNQKCLRCYNFDIEELLPLEQYKQIINMLYGKGFRFINWSGGESLMHPYIADLLSYAKQIKFYNNVVTNGRLLNHGMLEKLKENMDHVSISIDSLNPQTNITLNKYTIHEKPGEYEEMVLSRIAGMGVYEKIRTSVNTVIFPENRTELIDIGKKIISLGIDHWHIQEFTPSRGRAAGHNNAIMESQQRTFKTLSSMFQIPMTFSPRQRFDDKFLMIDPMGRMIETYRGQDKIVENFI
jgi:radical S-adenosyl methionine domain-containing protein 2